MENKKSFTIDYNGKRAHCVDLGDSYMIQLTYKPVYVRMITDDNGVEHWIEEEDRRETPLAQELGKLIRKQYLD
ncbi:MAG TPA: hypothetical protein VNR87_17100 [Flavisolibacter sp.]|nr:hypothetical protein [Flavisolibacter sp.]